jgi:hypothetical protein
LFPQSFTTFRKLPEIQWGMLLGYFDTPHSRYPMLSDTKIRALKPKDKPYRLFDERGL